MKEIMTEKKENTKKYTKETLKYYLRATLRYKKTVLLSIFSMVVIIGLQIYIPILYKDFFNIIGENVLKGEIGRNALLGIFSFVVLLISLNWLLWRSVEFPCSYYQVNILRELSNECFRRVHKQGAHFFEENFIGALVKRVNKFVFAYEKIADSILWDFIPAIFTVLFIAFSLLKINIYLSLIVIFWVSFFTFVNIVFSKFKLKYDIKREEVNSKMSGLYADTFTNHRNIKFFNSIGKEQKEFEVNSKEWSRIFFFSWTLSTISGAIQGLFAILLEVGMMYYAIILWEQGGFTVGDFVLIQTYMLLIFEKTWGLGRVIRFVYEAISEANEMTEIFERPLDIVDAKNAKELHVKEGGIAIEKVHFYYKKTRKIFKDLSLKISAGSSVAFVGHSGAGKSSLIKLFLREYDPQRGKITIDGADIKKVTQESLWKSIAFVPQEPMLFHRTLLENIRYGNPFATDEDVMEAAKKARCHDFIMNLEEGYDTLVGERGVKLSGGERQRVAIARAILKDAPILILDEATSSLDSESEKAIQDALEYLMQGKTVMVIAHRLSTIMKMDRIIVLDEGEIVEDGNHKALLKKDGVYKKLWDLQAGGFIE